MLKTTVRGRNLKENIAAISAEFHMDKRFARFYASNGSHLSGFPGIWAWMIDLGDAFSDIEKRLINDKDGDFEWIDAIMDYVGMVHAAGNIPDHNALREMARKAIKKHIIKGN